MTLVPDGVDHGVDGLLTVVKGYGVRILRLTHPLKSPFWLDCGVVFHCLSVVFYCFQLFFIVLRCLWIVLRCFSIVRVLLWR